MRTEVAIITTEFLRDFINSSMKELQLDIDYVIHPYNSFSDLAGIFDSIPNRIDGVMTTGAFPAQVIRHSFPDTRRVIRAINNDDAGIYKMFLHLFNQNRALDASRIYADLIAAAGLELDEYLFGEREAGFSELADKHISSMTLEELSKADEIQAEKHLKLWREGRIDLSITRFSSIVDRLKNAGLPVLFAYPSRGYLRAVCLETVQAVHIKQMRENQAAAIMVTARISQNNQISSFERRQERLRQTIQRFKTSLQLDFVPRDANMGLEILTVRKNVALVTEDFTVCRMRPFLESRLDFDVNIGYGLGADLYQARINAVDANREAARIPGSASCLINERDELIAPLHGETNLVVPREISGPAREAARLSGLSGFTVEKVLAAVKSARGGRLSSRELASQLSITQRSANRFLSALNEAGLAKVIEARRTATRGRPERIYEIPINE
ncbi:MAG: hypothetical protein LBS31_05420 [Candidatus Adiutrix sp.]|jgi:hypothetical protein|nr:hypothetical protein [Candidatus Adiutrix sp.]